MTDEELVARYLAARDPADFRELVERNGPRVLRLVASILGPFRGVDAEETAQDVFLRAHERLAQFRGEARFSTWLHRIAWTVAANRTRLLAARRVHVPLEAALELAGPADPGADAEAAERAARVAEAVEALPDLYRTVVYLHYWQEASVAEIGDLLGAPPNTVKSYLFRARERVLRALEAKGAGR